MDYFIYTDSALLIFIFSSIGVFSALVGNELTALSIFAGAFLGMSLHLPMESLPATSARYVMPTVGATTVSGLIAGALYKSSKCLIPSGTIIIKLSLGLGHLGATYWIEKRSLLRLITDACIFLVTDKQMLGVDRWLYVFQVVS